MDRYHNKLEYITFPESITDTLSFENKQKNRKKKKNWWWEFKRLKIEHVVYFQNQIWPTWS